MVSSLSQIKRCVVKEVRIAMTADDVPVAVGAEKPPNAVGLVIVIDR
jgi:hypothetical protein